MNRSDYEIYFLDYIDENLSVDLIDDFLEFLEENPDLKEELESVAQGFPELPAETFIFEPKKDLFRHEITGSSEFDDQAVACMEGDLDKEQEAAFKQALRHDPIKQKAYHLIAGMRLQPDNSMTFPDKTALMRKEKKYARWIWPGLAAAVCALGLLIPVIFPEKDHGPATQQPVTTTPPEGTVYHQETEKKQSFTQKVAGISDPEPERRQKPVTKQKQADAAVAEERTETPALLRPIEVSALTFNQPTIRRLHLPKGDPQKDVQYTKLSDFLAQKLLDIPKGEPVTLANIARAGLQAAEGISQKKLHVRKSEEGHIEAIGFNSLLVGFSIPVKKNR